MNVLFALLLGAFPGHFRRRFGVEILEQALADCAQAFEEGLWRSSWTVAATCAAMRAGLAERLRPTWRQDHAQQLDLGGEVGMMVGNWMRDLRHAVRALGRAPGFTLAAVGTLTVRPGLRHHRHGAVPSVVPIGRTPDDQRIVVQHAVPVARRPP